MELQAKLHSIATDWKTNKTLITFEIEQGFARKAIETIKDKTLRLTVVQWREKRGKDANSYYWQLLSQLARLLSKERLTSTAYLHNMMLRSLGMLKLEAGQPVITLHPDDEKVELALLENELVHYKPTSQTTEVMGTTYRVYFELKPSHDMDYKEFSDLINALVSECKEQGIETLTPEEISHLEGLEGHADEVNNAV